MTTIEDSQLLDSWESLLATEGPAIGPSTERAPHYYKPLGDAVDDFVHWAQTPEQRVTLGIQALDDEMRGVAPGELCLIIGYSHSGKTLLLLEILKNNRHKRVALFSPDEPRQLLLVKLACALKGMKARDLEYRIAKREMEAVQTLREVARDGYPNLAVFDQGVGIADMDRALAETTDIWGASPDLVVFDYLELLGGGGDVPDQANAMKAWGRRHNVPLIVLHQTSRSSGAAGRRLTISSGAYGGEQQATHLIGVRRKVFELEQELYELQAKSEKATNPERILQEIDDLQYQIRIHAHTLTVSLLKNKRPDSTRLPEIDYEIEQGTGGIRRLADGELPLQMSLAGVGGGF